MNGLIDTHAHLTFPEFDGDRQDVLARAWQVPLEHIILIGSGGDLSENKRAIALAHTDERLFATVGVHPHEVLVMNDEWLGEIETLLMDKKVVAVGEIGLDYHHKHTPPDIQCKWFAKQIALANKLEKPVVVHDRDAHEDAWRILQEQELPKKCLFHCFSGDVTFAKKIIDAGIYISIPGVVTFKNAKVLREVVANVPLERMVIETDCPYLAPEPNRGKRNEPAFVIEVAKKIAEIKGFSLDDVARVATLNAKRFFNLPDNSLSPQIAYQIRNSLYLNITNRCNLACRFCPKNDDFEVKGHYLKLEHEPDVEEIFQAIGEPLKYDEVVFCGYGEPTLRLEILKVITKRMKEIGVKKVRLNTDGLANLVYERNVLPELEGLIDSMSISLNAPDAKTHMKHCPSKFKESAFNAICEFIKEAKKYIPEVVASVVALPDLDIEACRKKAQELGVPLRVREYMNVG